MAKKKGLLMTFLAALFATSGYAGYMASTDEFSSETKSKFSTFLNKFKNVETDVKRTYISLGDESKFEESYKNLGKSAVKLATGTGDLVKSASKDMYNHAVNNVKNAVEALTASSDTSKTKKKSNAKTSNKAKKSTKTKNVKKAKA